ncbi:MAG: DegT/DnrJ/EryC1/StrS family aminotransferase [Gammaproteobacteria bacterium]|nr:DegT/DnrJ/EryC1/StrS family aminotransferase [Gammaproteobacteria bacterium]
MKYDPIPMVDLHQQYQSLKVEIQSAINVTLENTTFIMGPNVHALEDEVSEYLNIKHSVSCSSGTDALHLALRALDIGPGDEVITPSFTFAATAEAIRYVGATPIFVDIDAETLNIDSDCIKNAITDKTRAVIAVHLFGLAADIDKIKAIIKDKNIFLVEDCAQSFGADYKGNKTGTLGDISCFSFFPSKNLGCYGDGGMICTASDKITTKLKLLRNHGSPIRYEHTIIGYNSRLDEIQAAILRIKLKHIDMYNQQRHENATKYTNALTKLGIVTPNESKDSTHVYHQYTIQDPRRNKILKVLSDQNIASAIYYPKGLHLQTAFTNGSPSSSLPITEKVSSNCLSLPMYPELSAKQIDRVVGVFKQQLE